MPKILIVDDEEVIRQTLIDILEYEGYEIDTAADGAQAVAKIQANGYDAVLCDIKMPRMDGMEVLDTVAPLHPELPIVMLSGHGSLDTAVEAVRKGAFDYIAKPPDLNRLLITMRNAVEKNHLVAETKVLRRKVNKSFEILGQSGPIQAIKDTIEKVATTEARVLITGGNGSGKELVARNIHELSNRREGPFVEVNCAAIPNELIESELFGHEKGSFTSAHKQRIGKFEQAHGGTLFLDEIGDMSLSAQAKVLRALQENRITRVGGEKDIAVNPRVVAATNKDLIAAIAEGKFREDLYHRLAVIIIQVPSLNQRPADIPLLAHRFLAQAIEDNGMSHREITLEAEEALKRIKWTGNVRELRNVVERLAILCPEKITAAHVQAYANPQHSTAQGRGPLPDTSAFTDFQEFKSAMERVFIIDKLNLTDWNISKTADLIGIQRSHLYTKMEKYVISKDGD
ncbi:MAG: sigma-54-dependent Fis family transcriptional regulator [Bacteroidetes bacterium]|jgi:DNA-binding NtrC family response regulator|nr:sigma-54-dependent Fis family transcriptional regulator [Bacteroidota bacterium]